MIEIIKLEYYNFPLLNGAHEVMQPSMTRVLQINNVIIWP